MRERRNHLAHFLLAPEDDAARAGTLIADFSRGSNLGMYHPGVAYGIRLHRRIDALVDTSEQVRALRMLAEPPLRRYAGIVLDVLFDHALMRQWCKVCAATHADFSAAVYASLERTEAAMPEQARRFSLRLREHELLASCASLEGCEKTLKAISTRLKQPVPLASAVPMFASHLAGIDDAALALMDRLRAGIDHLALP